MESVTGLCRGNLITIMPTPTVIQHVRTTTRSEGQYEVEEPPYEVNETTQENEDNYNKLSTESDR